MKQRRLGQCPISPLEAGIFLRAMGFTSDTPIYVAAMVEHLYPSENVLDPLKMLFPRTLLKRDLLTEVSIRCTASTVLPASCGCKLLLRPTSRSLPEDCASSLACTWLSLHITPFCLRSKTAILRL